MQYISKIYLKNQDELQTLQQDVESWQLIAPFAKRIEILPAPGPEPIDTMDRRQLMRLLKKLMPKYKWYLRRLSHHDDQHRPVMTDAHEPAPDNLDELRKMARALNTYRVQLKHLGKVADMLAAIELDWAAWFASMQKLVLSKRWDIWWFGDFISQVQSLDDYARAMLTNVGHIMGPRISAGTYQSMERAGQLTETESSDVGKKAATQAARRFHVLHAF